MHLLAGTVLAATVLTALPAAAAGPERPVLDTVCSVTAVPEPDLSGTQSVPPPAFESVYRQTAGDRSTWEVATNHDGTYWSRAGGNDVVAELANAQAGYTFEVYKNRKLVHSEPVSLCDPYVTIPVPTDDGEYTRTVRFVAASGAGPSENVSLGVDTVAPVIASQSQTSDTTARVTFSEIVAGTDIAEDWYVTHLMADETGTTTAHTTAMSVSFVDPQTRDIAWDFPLAAESYVGVNYFASDPAQRYVDHAGNVLANTL
jgi:hypothetical protein